MVAKKRPTIRLPQTKDLQRKRRAETDIGRAVLAATYLSQSLKLRIAGFLIDDAEVDQLLERSLRHFGARISGAYYMGLISEDEYHDLKIIKGIRDQFAHELERLSFSDVEVKKRCEELQLPNKIPGWQAPNARAMFDTATDFLLEQLKMRTQHQKERCVVPEAFEVTEN